MYQTISDFICFSTIILCCGVYHTSNFSRWYGLLLHVALPCPQWSKKETCNLRVDDVMLFTMIVIYNYEQNTIFILCTTMPFKPCWSFSHYGSMTPLFPLDAMFRNTHIIPYQKLLVYILYPIVSHEFPLDPHIYWWLFTTNNGTSPEFTRRSIWKTMPSLYYSQCHVNHAGTVPRSATT